MASSGGGSSREGRAGLRSDMVECSVDLSDAGPSKTAVPRSSSVDSGRKRRRAGEDDGQGDARLIEVRTVSDRMREVLVETGTRMTKSNVMTLLERVSEMETIVLRVLLENERLKGQLSECRVNEVKNVREKETLVSSYASVVSKSVAGQRVNVVCAPPPKRSVPRHTVVVRPEKEGMTSEDVKKQLMKVVKPAIAGIRVNAVRMMRSGGVAIETASAEELGRLASSSKFSEAGLTVETARKIGPKVIIYDVPSEWTTNALMNALYDRNLKDVCTENEFKERARVISRGGKKGSDVGNVILELSARMCECLCESGRMYAEWRAFKVRSFEMVSRCYGCYGFGHRLRECKEKGRVCKKCGKTGHVLAECKSADEVCRNCLARKLDAKHSVLSDKCPEYMKALERMRERVSNG